MATIDEGFSKYLTNFYLLDTKKNNLKCKKLSELLYKSILNRFQNDIDEENYQYFCEYQDRINDLIIDLREKSPETISKLLDVASKHDICLGDIIIMMWCLPHADDFYSKKNYKKQYKLLIAEYNHKLISIVDNAVIKNFCIETISKVNYVPIHCLDILWHHMDSNMEINLVFANANNAKFIGFTIDEIDDNENTITSMIINIQEVFDLNLGLIKVNGICFRDFLMPFLLNPIIIKKILNSYQSKIFIKQFKYIHEHWSEYFGDDIIVPDEVKQLLNEY